jgi:hypothetical protein
MKLYKLRSLRTCTDLERAIDILQTGKFWCSRFSELNDPMEGHFSSYWAEGFEDAQIQKRRYRICSFAEGSALKDPRLWGYYACGFRGIAIEILPGVNEVVEVIYDDEDIVLTNLNPDKVKEVLCTKLKIWTYEGEYRFLRIEEENRNKIGTIKAVYYGDPYHNMVNNKDIHSSNIVLQNYSRYVRILKIIALKEGIPCFPVAIEGQKVGYYKSGEFTAFTNEDA